MPDLYSIRLEGHLGATALSAFPAMVSQRKGSETVLTGLLPDRSAVFGVLAQIEALGLELTECSRVVPKPCQRQKEGHMSAGPIEVVGEWLQNLLDPDLLNRLVAPDATYVSLNAENAELNRIMPWAGTSRGPQAFLDNLGLMFTRWENQAFNVTTMFASGEKVAVFGDFRYKSHSLGKTVSSPFSILVKVVDGKVTYLQFLEDSYATAASFRKNGSWTIQTEVDAAPFEV
jgi:ketosteroid isomerase-like protein